MKQINVHEAKTHLSRLVEEVADGQDIIIAKNGVPVARLTRLAERSKPRQPGALAGRIRILPGFDEPLPDDMRHAFGQPGGEDS